MKTPTWVSTLALATGRISTRSMSTPSTKLIATVARKAPQNGQPALTSVSAI